MPFRSGGVAVAQLFERFGHSLKLIAQALEPFLKLFNAIVRLVVTDQDVPWLDAGQADGGNQPQSARRKDRFDAILVG